MGTIVAKSQTARGTALALLLIAPLLAGCHEFYGHSQTPVAVHNESSQDTVLRRGKLTWLIEAGASATLEHPYGPPDPLRYEILDAATCSLIMEVSVDTRASSDSLIVIPASGPATVRPMGKVALRDRPPDLHASGDVCV